MLSEAGGQIYSGMTHSAFANKKMYYFEQISYNPDVKNLHNEGFSIYWYDTNTGEEGILKENGSKKIFSYDEYGTAVYAWDDTLYVIKKVEGNWWLAALDPDTCKTTPVCMLMEETQLLNYSQSDLEEIRTMVEKGNTSENIFPILYSTEMQDQVKLYNGAVYCILDENTRLVQIDIASGTRKELYHADQGTMLDKASFQFSEDKIYFELVSSKNPKVLSMMCYALSEQKVEELLTFSDLKWSDHYYVVLQGGCILYYVPEKGVMMYDPVTKEERIFCNQTPLERFTENCGILYDGMFVYLTNMNNASEDGSPYSNRVYVMDLSGRLISYISFCNSDEEENLKKAYKCSLMTCGNTSILYGKYFASDVKSQLMVLDKEKFFVEGIEEWTTLKGK